MTGTEIALLNKAIEYKQSQKEGKRANRRAFFQNLFNRKIRKQELNLQNKQINNALIVGGIITSIYLLTKKK